MDGQPILEELNNLFAKYRGIEKAVLFGSRSRGDFNERSDYDIAVYGSLTAGEKISLRYECVEEINTLHKIDLVFMDEQTEEKFIGSILSEGKVFYDKI